MKNYKLIPQITLWVLMALGVVVMLMFFFSGSEGTMEVAGDYLDIPKHANLMLYWNYILVSLVCLVTLVFVVVKFVSQLMTDTKKALVSLSVVLMFVALVVICWFAGSPEQINIIGYEGTDNVGTMAQMADACMYLTYTLFAATVLAVIGGFIYTKCLK